MAERFLSDRVTLLCGDSRAQLATIADDSIDAVVTDPPYGLNFMGNAWDEGAVAFDPAFWVEVLRVLKPGGHVLALGGTRTYHRLACAVEDAGFEIRDCVMWVYGTGFPKSHDVSKGIDKARNEDIPAIRVICRHIRSVMDIFGLKSQDLVQHFNGCHPRLIDHWAARDTDSQPALPTWPQWQKLQEVLSLDGSLDAEVRRLNERKGEPSDDWKSANVVGEYAGVPGGFGEYRFNSRDKLICDPSDAAKQWSGWGTALKPSVEPCVLARKPLSEGTIAANVLKWGTGALNIDACRVETNDKETRAGGRRPTTHEGYQRPNSTMFQDKSDWSMSPQGRWPANLIHDGSEEVLAAFPAQAGGGFGASTRGGKRELAYGFGGTMQEVGYGDSGSAARFFYQAQQDSVCHSTKPASDAESPFDLKSEHVVSALSRAVAATTDRLAVQNTSFQARDMSVLGLELKIVCESVTEVIQNIERRSWLALPPENITARLGPVMCAAIQNQTGITTITVSLLRLDRFVEAVTFGIIETNAEVGEQACAHRLFYSAKADHDDRLGSKHPTVKPLDLMQYLCKLITPKGGTVLDPFAGTGTTGEAAYREGFCAVLIEREPEYQDDIRRRMALVLSGPDERVRKTAKQKSKGKPIDHGPLFAELNTGG